MTTGSPETIAADQLARLERAWNTSDGAAFGAAFAGDSEFVDIRGGHHRGATAIAEGHQVLFDAVYAGSSIGYRLETARQVAPGCIVAVAEARLDVPSGPVPGTHRSRLSAVICGADGGWSIAAFHNTLQSDSTSR
ncbi:MAG TPA: SgcJ/EcaC family oxidoreductase [Actinomycetes bacterium]|jgi:uncharacterized protein (TIGR02246 family)|nr:SgcJ/EcaC family oxidoreductase [Actinomycetes bacterium]